MNINDISILSLFQRNMGWMTRNHDVIAKNKAVVAWRESLTLIGSMTPPAILLRAHDTIYPGAFAFMNTIVAASGCKPEEDAMVAGCIGLTFMQLCELEKRRFKEENPDNPFLT